MLADTDRACLVVVWVFCVASLEDGKGREQEWVGGQGQQRDGKRYSRCQRTKGERGAEYKNDSVTVAKDIQMFQGVKLSYLRFAFLE